MVGIERFGDDEEMKRVQALIYAHLEATESPKANEILKNWSTTKAHFWVVVPHPAEAKPASQPVHELERPKSETGGGDTTLVKKGGF
jgi:glutamate synthase domain-containing protein 3